MSPSPEGAQRPECLPALIPAFRRCCGSVDRDMDRDLKPIADVPLPSPAIPPVRGTKTGGPCGRRFFCFDREKARGCFLPRTRRALAAFVRGRFLLRGSTLRRSIFAPLTTICRPMKSVRLSFSAASLAVSIHFHLDEAEALRAVAAAVHGDLHVLHRADLGEQVEEVAFRRPRRPGCPRRAWA